ncbi:hypothetical protein AgCh_002263 [Apium graveolens]
MVDEMIHDVEDLLMHQPKVLETLVDDSKKNFSIQGALIGLPEMLSPNSEFPTSTYEAKKIPCPMENHSSISNTLNWLAYGPDILVRSYQVFDVNGYTFYIKCQDDKSTVQNSRVSVEASSIEFERGNSITSRDLKKSYYGVIEEIWELDYKDFKVALFRCKWFDIHRDVQLDESGSLWWSIVLQIKRRIVGIDNVEDEEEYNQFDEDPLFSIGIPTTLREDNASTNYSRTDHDEDISQTTFECPSGNVEALEGSDGTSSLPIISLQIPLFLFIGFRSFSFFSAHDLGSTTTIRARFKFELHVIPEIKDCDKWFPSASDNYQLQIPDEVFYMDQDKDNEEQNYEGVSKKRTRGPTLCTKLNRRMVNQNLECSISFDEYGDPIGDMLKDFRSYIGSVARVQVDINIESWDQVDQGLKDAIWDDIKSPWKLDDSRKKNVLERAGKQWRNFKILMANVASLSNEYYEQGELQRQVSDGSWTLEGHDDILSRALG